MRGAGVLASNEASTRGTTAADFADRSNRRARLDMAANRAQAAAQKALIQMSCAEPSPFPESCYKILPCRVSTVVVQRFCKPKVGGSNPSPGIAPDN
jgi:hypothetical protein